MAVQSCDCGGLRVLIVFGIGDEALYHVEGESASACAINVYAANIQALCEGASSDQGAIAPVKPAAQLH